MNLIFQILLDREFKPNTVTFEYLCAFRLVCSHESWEWTCNKFLKTFVRLKIVELKKQRSRSPTKTVELLAFYFMLQGFIISTLCPTDRFQVDVASDLFKPYADELLKDYKGR